jgi:hypothetical protein
MKEKKTAELTAATVANVIGLILFNTVPLWRQYTRGVVLQDFVQILWAANLSFLVQLSGNLSMIFFRPPRFAAVVQILGTAAGLLSLIVFFTVFPLDFSAVGVAWVNSVMKIALIAGMGGAALGLIVQAIQLATGWRSLAYSPR